MEKFCKHLIDHAIKIINYEEKEIHSWLIKKLSLMESKKYIIYAKKDLVLIKMIKIHLHYAIKSEIIVIALENLEELLILFTI